MSISDSPYTNPDFLRAKYRNPKNVLQNIDERTAREADAAQQAALSASVSLTLGGGVTGTVGGGSGSGGDGIGCPALTEYVLARQGNQAIAKQVGDLSTSDCLFHPITRIFHQITELVVIAANCYRLTSQRSIEQIVSVTHPVIQSLRDVRGTKVEALLEMPARLRRTVECLGVSASESTLRSIEFVGIRECLRIALKDGHIYASGTMAGAYLLGHNNKSSGPRNPTIE